MSRPYVNICHFLVGLLSHPQGRNYCPVYPCFCLGPFPVDFTLVLYNSAQQGGLSGTSRTSWTFPSTNSNTPLSHITDEIQYATVLVSVRSLPAAPPGCGTDLFKLPIFQVTSPEYYRINELAATSSTTIIVPGALRVAWVL